ncbi:unnamed protein product [Peniophora sp. CBMAI 1063]|nr:unnamed protein product [Peniophora sp. CBMAI 1063]
MMLGSGGLPPKQVQGQQQNGPGVGGVGGQDVPPPPLSGQDFTLSNVLHFLQSEWRKYERDRNEWEIERAEMRARIALLEGERRSFENVKVDLMRRIKMLEYALRVERSKQLNQPATAPAKHILPKEDANGAPKEGSAASGSPRSEDSPLPPQNIVRASTWGAGGASSSWSASSALGKPPPGRDPKSRARSRDYLKQCLQEIQYLTSPQAMNPLPTRPLAMPGPASGPGAMPVSLPNVPPFDQMGYGNRPRKLMDNVQVPKDFPLMNGNQQQQQQAQQQSQQQQQPFPSSSGQPQQDEQEKRELQQQQPFGDGLNANGEVPTAIFRPDNRGEWKERLRAAHEADQARLAAAASYGEEQGQGQEEEAEAEDDNDSLMGDGEGEKIWKTKRTLRNHLDAVRALAFHPSELCLASGGDDCTVKIWRMDVAGLASSAARPVTEVEPQLTLRGHTAAITRLVIAPASGLLYSASMDSTIRAWALPNPAAGTYAPYDSTRARGELIGHTDVVWDLALVRDERTLVSAGAEGAVKVWDVSSPSANGPGSLKMSWTFHGVQSGEGSREEEDEDLPGACAVEAVRGDLKKVAVAFANGSIKVFDIATGAEERHIRVPAQEGERGQVNCLVSHPTMPLLVAGHEDKHISIFDITTGQCTYSMPAHLDGVAALALDAAGLALASGGHDCSVRFWDVLGQDGNGKNGNGDKEKEAKNLSMSCVQEITSHRRKADEGVLALAFHNTLPFMASAGADGVVKLYASSSS